MEDDMNTTVLSNDAPAPQRQSTVPGDIPAPSAAMDAISNAQLQLPPFWQKNPAVWFTQVEALFDLRRITSQPADDMPLDKLAELADRVNDYSGASSAVSSTTVTSDLEARQSHLEEKIDRLMDTMAALQMDTPRRSPLARGGSRSRSRSHPRHTSDNFYWYHARFGASAAKCRQPCRWQGNMEASH
ncbi:uncharacterized protein [Dermacentor albipictus]|uniref:uncharacterized protein n=1 Tax=Dermacentor albipictus TaxID=60249 RepID=UPI0038FCB493